MDNRIASLRKSIVAVRMRQLAATIAAPPKEEPLQELEPVYRRLGVVIRLVDDGVLEVSVGQSGATSMAGHLDSYVPVQGDTVICLQAGVDIFVLGKPKR